MGPGNSVFSIMYIYITCLHTNTRAALSSPPDLWEPGYRQAHTWYELLLSLVSNTF